MQVLVYVCSTIPHLFCVSRFCSRYGLREIELLELLAPPGLTQLPHALWARLSKSLDAYTKLFETQDVSTLRFFHQQISRAVAARYLDTARSQHSVHRRLMRFFARKVSWREAEVWLVSSDDNDITSQADPLGDLTWLGNNERDFGDLVYYQLKGLKLRELEQTIGNLRFLSARARFGPTSVEGLLKDYSEAQEEIRRIKYSSLKSHLRGESRHSILSWISEFFVFVSSSQRQLTANPELVFQYALNQPDGSAPNKYVSAPLVAKDQR